MVSLHGVGHMRMKYTAQLVVPVHCINLALVLEYSLAQILFQLFTQANQCLPHCFLSLKAAK